jgi:hypothetical protein
MLGVDPGSPGFGHPGLCWQGAPKFEPIIRPFGGDAGWLGTAPAKRVAAFPRRGFDSHRLRMEGAAPRGATGLENRDGGVTPGGSTPPPSAEMDEPYRCTDSKKPPPRWAGACSGL